MENRKIKDKILPFLNEQPRRPERGAFWYKQRGIQMDLNKYNDPRVGE